MADAKSVSGDEHPSGLRDAIDAAVERWYETIKDEAEWEVNPYIPRLLDYIQSSVRAWLSVVSEGEIEAAARAIYDGPLPQGPAWDSGIYHRMAEHALVASRGVLLPKETPGSSYSAGSPSMKEHP